MATSLRLIRRYVWLVDTIRRAGSITLEDINRKWAYNSSLNYGQEDEIPERTFHRHREAISELFDIDIRCNRYDGNKYYIANEESLNKPSFTSWLFNGLSIDNQMMENREIADRIIFEETPGGTEYLSPIIEAISTKKMIAIKYKRFNTSDANEWVVAPCFIKQAKRRWYLIGKNDGHESYTVFALDRIHELSRSDNSYEISDLDNIQSDFDKVIGVNLDEDFDCEEVILRVYGKQRPYIEALPLHSSQNKHSEGQDFTDYSFMVKPEYEFQREILRLGPDAKVISPKWLRDEIKWLAEEVINRYN